MGEALENCYRVIVRRLIPNTDQNPHISNPTLTLLMLTMIFSSHPLYSGNATPHFVFVAKFGVDHM